MSRRAPRRRLLPPCPSEDPVENTRLSPIRALLGECVGVLRPEFIRICESSVNAALMLNQAMYWTERTADTSGWFYKTRQGWRDELGLSRTQQERERKRLRQLGFLQERRRGNPARMFYRLDTERVCEALRQLAEKQPTSWQESSQQDGRKSAIKLAGKCPTLKGTENTQRLPEKSQHACSAMLKLWISLKAQLKRQLSPAEWELWVRPAYLLKPMGHDLLIALPPSGKIAKAARARSKMLTDLSRAAGWGAVHFTRYPDDYDCERIREEYPHFYAQMLGNKKREGLSHGSFRGPSPCE